MSRRPIQRLVRAGILVSLSVSWLHAQGRGGGEWTTSGFDAQRSGLIELLLATSLADDPPLTVREVVMIHPLLRRGNSSSAAVGNPFKSDVEGAAGSKKFRLYNQWS
jgi:hypothetical protein